MTDTPPTLPDGLRIYAIGDVHGRLDLLLQLLEKIAEDAKSTSARIQKIFLGDYIDRGFQSKETIDYLINWRAAQEEPPPIFLLGNHELIMRNILARDVNGHFGNWLQYGGRETLFSYGLRPNSLNRPEAEIIDELVQKTPEAHGQFLKNLPLSASFGDYFFCHAGVDPAIPLEAQTEQDLVWIRRKFLDYKMPFGKVVVHGHSISLEAELLVNRIGIDTGAYATGKLTALGLEGTKQWLLQTG